MKLKLTDGFRMSGDRAVKCVGLERESAWLCAQRKAMEPGIESLMTLAVVYDQRFKKAATPTNVPSGKSPSGRG